MKSQNQLGILLEEVASGKVSVIDARAALEGVDLDIATYQKAVEHGVFNPVEPGAVVSAKLAPSGESALVIFLFVWGLFWSLYWSGSMIYGLFNSWDQQQLSYHLFITFLTSMIMGIVYMKWVLPDLIAVKYARQKYIPEHTSRHENKGWVDYKL
jgi:hypothetical protein